MSGMSAAQGPRGERLRSGRRRWGVKVCGVTRVEDAELAAELGAGFIGLNFFPPSPRFVAVERARQIADAVRGRARVVGVFVNLPAAEVAAIDAAVGLDLLQLHGDEGPEEVAALGERAIKVVRTRGALDGDLGGFAPSAYPAAWGFLFDVLRSDLYGGSGEPWAYASLSGLELDRPCFVAGGIRPGTARRALEESGADGVDVCSGVESAPGIKDQRRLAELMEEVLVAF